MSHYSILHFIFEPDFNTGFLHETWICPYSRVSFNDYLVAHNSGGGGTPIGCSMHTLGPQGSLFGTFQCHLG